MNTTVRRPRAALLVLARGPLFHAFVVAPCVMTLVGCQAPQLGGAVPDSQPDGGVVAAAGLSQTIRFDVDPLHGAAFEQPFPQRALQAVTVSRTLKLLVDFPGVTHDPATGRTTVSLSLANAGDNLNYLACKVGGERRVITPNYQWNTAVTQAGQTQTKQVVFDNPGGGGFMVELTFTGYMAATGVVTTGAATAAPSGTPTAAPTAGPTASPTAAPTAGPTASPTAAPTASPTAAPTGAPTATPDPAAASGAWIATADSSYGGLPPSRVLDGDLASQWANDGYQAAAGWLAIDTGSSRTLTTVGVKAKPFGGNASYRIETSADGRVWTPATGPLRNTGWTVEPKALPAGTLGRHVRLAFTNDPASPEQRFVVYELTLNGGGTPATPIPTPAPSAQPTSPPATGSLLRTFDAGDALGQGVADWIDPNDEGFAYGWMPRVTWRVTPRDGSNQFMHDGLSNTADLSFRRYRGTQLGTANGALPRKYLAEVDVTPIQSYTYAPTGDQGTQFYYVDPTNYFELVIKPDYYEAWSAVNAEPFQSRGWTRLFYSTVKTQAGTTRKLACEVDATTNGVKLYLDGTLMGTVSSSVVRDRPHYFALRGTGNIVSHDNIKIVPR